MLESAQDETQGRRRLGETRAPCRSRERFSAADALQYLDSRWERHRESRNRVGQPQFVANMIDCADRTLPCQELRDILLPAFAPCSCFGTACGTMRWQPKAGHVPRGFCGATGRASDVNLVLVVAEPGDPHLGESYDGAVRQEMLFESVCRYVRGCFENGKDPFHRNVRAILNDCWPDLPFHEQLRHTWITESVLCSASVECGSVPPSVRQACVGRYLARQLDVLPNAIVVAAGGKAHERMRRLPRRFLRVGSVAPPGCNQQRVQQSWRAISTAVHAHRS